MKYSLDIQKQKKLINLRVEGHLIRELAAQQYREALQLCEQNDIFNLLIDVRKARAVDTSRDQISFVQEDVKRGHVHTQHPRIAVVAGPGDRSHGHVVFLLKQAGIEVELFREIKQAEKFLLIQPKQMTDE